MVTGEVDATDLPTLQKNSAFNAELEQEMDKVGLDAGGEITGLVVSAPQGKGFRMDKLDAFSAADVFNNMGSNKEVQTALENKGFTFSPRVLATHMKSWEHLRNNQELVAQYLSQREFPTQAKSFRHRTIERLTEEGNAPKVATASAIFKYLERVGDVPRKTPKEFVPLDIITPDFDLNSGA